MKERDEVLEEWIDCPKCGNEDAVVTADYQRMTNDSFDHKFEITIQCDECGAKHAHSPLYTKSNTRKISNPHGSHSGGPAGGIR